MTQLNNFSLLLEKTAAKYRTFADHIECFDASIFMSIPSLLVLKGLTEPVAKSTSERFLPGISDKLAHITVIEDDEESLE